MPKKVALVTGANRGIGLEVCRQLARAEVTVILTARDVDKGRDAVSVLRDDGIEAHCAVLDVTHPSSVAQCIRAVHTDFGHLDILVNNAGVYLDRDQPGSTVDVDMVHTTMDTNVYGPLRVCQAVIPVMRQQQYGRIVNVSSLMGAFSHLESPALAYRMSKTALNAMTVILADELQGSNILINTMSPGWVRTDMGGAEADRSVEEGADTIVWLALLPHDGPNGGFFFDRKPVPW